MKNNSTDILRDKIAGALFGVAVGDALGGPLEFMDAKDIAKKYGHVEKMIGGGWLYLRPGETTDDTAMTLAVAEGIMESPDDPCQAIGRNFIAWIDSGPKDIGATCARAIRMAQRKAQKQGLEEPDVVCWNYGRRATAELNQGRSGGNGALMRAVYPAIYYQEEERAVRETINQGRMTHWDADSDEACKIYAAVVHFAIETAADGSDDPEAIFEHIYYRLGGTRYYIQGNQEEGNHGKLNPTGYVVDSLKCAIYALWEGDDFKGAVTKAANMGGDADTIAAICGGLAGAIYGYKAIPEDWIASLPMTDRKRIEAAVEVAVKNWRR